MTRWKIVTTSLLLSALAISLALPQTVQAADQKVVLEIEGMT